MKKKVGLFFGSFNPVHIGHLILANYILEHSDMKEVWFVVSPQNPLKNKKTLLDNENRLEMVERAIQKYPRMRTSNVEFNLPQPSYTIETLTYLKEKHPNIFFSLIMGEDNLRNLPKWKNYEILLRDYQIIVYPRIPEESDPPALPTVANHPNVHRIDAPIIELSATEIRRMIREGLNTRPMLPPEVYDYLDRSHFYK